MQAYKSEFIELAISVGALRFGEFELKSGRISPYFFNSGMFSTGRAAAVLGRCYADAATEAGLDFDSIFGPAYKGIALAALCAAALADNYGRDIPYCFNRKEAKAHGEGGEIVGSAVSQKALIVDDVITAGTAIREAVDIIHAAGGKPAGVLLALDRQEKGTGHQSAVDQVRTELGIPVISIIALADLVEHLQQGMNSPATLEAILNYRERYGA